MLFHPNSQSQSAAIPYLLHPAAFSGFAIGKPALPQPIVIPVAILCKEVKGNALVARYFADFGVCSSIRRIFDFSQGWAALGCGLFG